MFKESTGPLPLGQVFSYSLLATNLPAVSWTFLLKLLSAKGLSDSEGKKVYTWWLLRKNFRSAIFNHRRFHNWNKSIQGLCEKQEREATHSVSPFSTTVSKSFQENHFKPSLLWHLSSVWLSLHSAIQHKSPLTQYFLSFIPSLCDKIPLSTANL